MIRVTTTLIFLLITLPMTSGTGIFDVLNYTVWDGDWSVVNESEIARERCAFSGQWYLITSVHAWYDDGNTYVKIGGYRWNECGKYKYDSNWMTFHIRDNYSEWCDKAYRPYCLTQYAWDCQPQYMKDVLNNSTKFIGVWPVGSNSWTIDGWHPYNGYPQDPLNPPTQNSGHIFGWVGIRFRNASMLDGVVCINTIDDVEAVYDVWDNVYTIERKDGGSCTGCKDWTPEFDSMETESMVYIDGDRVVAQVNTTLKWYYYRYRCQISGDDIPCWDEYIDYTEYAEFRAVSPVPVIINNTVPDVTATITCYNNSFSPYTSIRVPTKLPIISTTFVYKNCTAKLFHKTGLVMDEYTKFTNNSFWIESKDQKLVSHPD